MLVYIPTYTWHPHAAVTRMYLRYESESQLHFMYTSIHFKHTRTHVYTDLGISARNTCQKVR